MFEGKAPNPPKAQNGAALAHGGEELRALEWGDLVARLAAARELRASLVAAGEYGLASFDGDLARKLAADHSENEPDHEHRVNFEDSANGKGDGGKDAADHNEAATGHPRT